MAREEEKKEKKKVAFFCCKQSATLLVTDLILSNQSIDCESQMGREGSCSTLSVCTWQAMDFPVKRSQGRTGGSSQLFPRSAVWQVVMTTAPNGRKVIHWGWGILNNHYTKHSGPTISTKILRFLIWTMSSLDGRGHSCFWTVSHTSDSKVRSFSSTEYYLYY